MAEIRLRDYEHADAENLNRIAVAAFDQFRDHYGDWPAMLAGLSKTSDLSASGEIIIAELQDKLAGAGAYFGPNSQKSRVLRSTLAYHSHAGRRSRVSRKRNWASLERCVYCESRT
jgi:hypothetical protein